MTPLDTTSSAPPGLPALKDSQYLSTSLMLSRQAPAGGETGLPPGLSAAPTFGGLLHALRRRWILGVPLAMLATIAAVSAVFLALPPQYVSQLRFQIKAKPDKTMYDVGDDGSEFALFKANQQALATSPVVLIKALKERLPNGKEVRDLNIVRAKGPAAVDWLERALKTDFLSGPEYLRVSLGGEDPDEVAALLNAIARAYLETNTEILRSGRDSQLNDYKERRRKLEEDHRKLLTQLNLKNADRQVKDRETIAQQHDQAMMDWGQAKSAQRSLYSRRDEVHAELVGLEARLKNLPKTSIPPEKLDEALRNDAIGNGYYKQLHDIAGEIQYYHAKLRDPEVYVRKAMDRAVEVRRKLLDRREIIRPEVEDQYREKLHEDIKNALAVGASKLSLLSVQEKSLGAEVKELAAAVKALEFGARNKPLDVQVLEEKIDNSKAALDEITRSITKFEFESPRSRVTLLQEAAPPNQKDFSRQTKLAGGGGLAAFGLVLFGIAFLEFRSRKISVAEEVSQGLGLNVVGHLPAIPAHIRRPLGTGASDLQGQVWNNQLNEAVDAVRTLLLHASRAEALRVIMVTSADSGEGKTSLASQLAASLARAWRKTLLIDGDLRNPATHQLFDLPCEPGFSEVLRGEIQASDAVRATALSRLWVLPAGTWDYHALQALAQEDVRTLIEELKQQYDFIIVDSPPVLPVADSLLLGQHVDGVLFSILRDVSRAPAVYAAQQKLQPLGIRILGAVMVGADTDVGRGRYRYLTHAESK
jgi:polysaccharide biosynthesis transport protein